MTPLHKALRSDLIADCWRDTSVLFADRDSFWNPHQKDWLYRVGQTLRWELLM